MATHGALLTSAGAVSFAGLLSLAVALGIGRFAFTPMLPFMLEDQLLSVAQGAWLAAANYVGYFVGALLAARIRLNAPTLAVASLAAIALATAAMALPGAPLWAALRFSAGLFSAWVFVATSVWCLGRLAQLQRADLSAPVYSGVGVGIAAAGLYCLAADVAGVKSQHMWIHLGLLAAACTIPVVVVLRKSAIVALAAQAAVGERRDLPRGTRGLIVCYGIMGYGYILPATFLPVLARSVVNDPAVFGWAWPVFGLMAAGSTLLAGMAIRHASRLHVWAGCQFFMGLGTLLPSVWLHGASIFLAAILVGGTFMVITLAGVQEIRARVSWSPAEWVGYLTAAFAIGQIAGPALSFVLLTQPELTSHALDLGLQSAAVLLVVSSMWIWRQAVPLKSRKELMNAH